MTLSTVINRALGACSSFVVMGGLAASPTVPVFDHVVTTTNGGFAGIPAGLLANGGTVGVAPGNYANQSLAANPSAMLYISGTDSNNMPVIDKFVCGNGNGFIIGNLDISYLDFTQSQWISGPQDIFVFGNPSPPQNTAVMMNDVTIHNCRFRGSYRGDINAYATFDTSVNLPEYANLSVTVAGGSYPVGDITILPENSYVGDLVADGTNIPLSANATGGSGFAGYMNVSGGVITYATITSGGTGYTTPSHPAKAISWTGKVPMASYLPNGVGGKVTITLGTTLTFRDNYLVLIARGFIPTTTIIGSLIEEGNFYHKFYTDAFATGINGSVAAQYIGHKWNRGLNQFSRTYDPTNPHGDGGQHWMTNFTGTVNPVVEYIGNIYLQTPNCRGDAGQGIFLADPGVNNLGYCAHVVGNYGGMLAPNGIIQEISDNCYVYGNTVIPGHPSNAGHANSIIIGLSNSSQGTSLIYGGSYVAKNITERIATTRTGAAQVLIENNTTTGFQNSATPAIYTTIFGDNAPVYSIEDVIARRKAIGAYADNGAFRDALWIDHVNRTYDRSREPSVIHWPTKINQPVSSAANSQWSRLLGGPDTVPVTATGGTFDTATYVNNSQVASGTVTTGLTSATLPRGIFVRSTVNTAATGSTLTTCNLNVNGRTSSFNAITQTLSSYTQADNQNTAWNKVTSVPSFTNAEGIILACRIKADSYVNNMTVIANSTGNNFNLLYSGNQWRAQFKSSANVAARFGMTQQAGTYITLLLAVDLTKDNAGEGLTMVSDGIVLALSSTNVVFPATGLLRLSTADLFPSASMGVMANGNGGNIFQGGIEWLWFNAYASAAAMPNIADPLIMAEFSTDKFNTATGATGILAAPLWFGYGANLGEYNGSIPNRGTSGGPAVLQAGTWI